MHRKRRTFIWSFALVSSDIIQKSEEAWQEIDIVRFTKIYPQQLLLCSIMHWKLAAWEFKSHLFPLCRKDFKQFRSIVWIERQDRKSLVVATKLLWPRMDRSRMTKIKSKLAGAPFPINYEQDTNCRFFFSTLKRIFPTQLPTMSWFKLKLTYILIIFSLDFCLYYHYNLKLRLLLRTYVKFIFVNRNTWLLWNLFKVT